MEMGRCKCCDSLLMSFAGVTYGVSLFSAGVVCGGTSCICWINSVGEWYPAKLWSIWELLSCIWKVGVPGMLNCIAKMPYWSVSMYTGMKFWAACRTSG